MSDRSDLAARLSSPAAIGWAGGLLLPVLLALGLPSELDGQDSVNFALGLLDFDPVLEQPHFPGYPVYIALCRLLAWSGCSHAVALALPGVLASAVLIPALIVFARRLEVPARVLPIAAFLVVAQPLVLFEGPRPMPDLLATACVWASLALVASERSVAAGVVLGLTLGVRIDLAPLACVVFALRPGARVHFASGLAIGIALWLPAFAVAIPPDGFARGARFAIGHFSVWGSTALSGAGLALAGRGLLLGLAAPVLPLFALVGGWHAPAKLRRVLGFALGPYAVWVLVGQNLASARHFLPLAPALAILAACALAAIERRTLRTSGYLAVACGAIAVSTFAPPSHPNGRELFERVRGACPDCEAIFAGPSERVLEYYAPAGAPLYRRSSIDEVRRDLRAWPELTGSVGITSELSGSAGLGAEKVEVASELGLYRIDAAALR